MLANFNQNDITSFDQSNSEQERQLSLEAFSPLSSSSLLQPNSGYKNVAKQIVVLNDQNEQIVNYQQQLLVTSDNSICLNSIMDIAISLRTELAFKPVQIWDDIRGQYQYMGSFPSYQKVTISLQDLRNCDTIFIKCLQQNSIEQKLPEKVPRKKKKMKPIKRVKERGIGEVREKIAQWRKLHEEGDKLNLDKAADIIGISRKTMDDYNLQMRRAEQLGFDFIKHKDSKMGVLRKFVKERSCNFNQQLYQQTSSEEYDQLELAQTSQLKRIVDVEEFFQKDQFSSNESITSYDEEGNAQVHQSSQQSL